MEVHFPKQRFVHDYWIVDPEQEQVIVLVLDVPGYREHGVFGVDTVATSVLLPGLAVSVNDVFAAGYGSPESD